jgi:indole-3-glycerol phosphate synthase
MKASGFSLDGMKFLKEAELEEVGKRIKEAGQRRRGHHALKEPDSGAGIIAEIKKSSPTMNEIGCEAVDIQASKYSAGGAAGISVLTDKNYFSGSWDDLRIAANSVSLPVLCKEFVYFEEQAVLAFLYGADMVLLIARALPGKRLYELYNFIKGAGLVPLVEIHSKDELGPVLELSPEILMVNLRNLDNLKIEYDVGFEALKAVPWGIIKVSASGIEDRNRIRSVHSETGTGLFLIGTALMKSDDPGTMIRELSNVY